MGLSANSTSPSVQFLDGELNLYRLDAERRRQQLVELISTASDLLWETDAELRIVSRRNLSDGRAESDNSPGDALTAESDPLLAAHLEDLQCHRPLRGVVQSIPGKDGSVIWLETNGTPFFNEEGTFGGFRGNHPGHYAPQNG